ncbi:MAG TPA: hypothetical protein VEN81_02470 [Planctomycetota bacterium]|nr:hypothetical protein [Planctomycetota bacterium]
MKIPALGLLLALGSCQSAPPAPPLPAPLSYKERVPEATFDRQFEITVDEAGKMRTVLRRSLLRDICHSGQLSPDRMRELETILDRWAGSTTNPPAAAQPWGILAYGDRRVSWAKGAPLPAEIGELVRWLKAVGEELPLEPDRDRGR